jgi:hypothetical protein
MPWSTSTSDRRYFSQFSRGGGESTIVRSGRASEKSISG